MNVNTMWIKFIIHLWLQFCVVTSSFHGERVDKNRTENNTGMFAPNNNTENVIETTEQRTRDKEPRQGTRKGDLLNTGTSQTNKSQKEVQETLLIPTDILPVAWKKMCSVKYKLITGSNFTAQNSFLVSCDLKEKAQWLLTDYRKWITTNEKLFYKYLPMNESIQFAFEFKCENRLSTSLSLPWPVKAQYLWYISVSNCIVYDHLAEYNVQVNFTDILRVAEFIDVEFKQSSHHFKDLMHDFKGMSKQFDCGSEAMERLVRRNCTKTIFNETDTGLSTSTPLDQATIVNDSISDVMPLLNNTRQIKNESQMMDIINKVGQQNQQIQHQCVFSNLSYIDESYSSYVAKHYSHYMTERRHYPALKYFNMSHSKLTKVLDIFLQWRRHFPKIKYLDFSHNKIKYFKSLFDGGRYGSNSIGIGILDLRHNNITTLTLDDLETLRINNRTVYVDIRDNPLNCDCKLSNVVKQLKNTSSIIELTRYKYLTEMKCSQPEQFKGQTVSELDDEALCEELEFVILAAPVVVLSTCVLVLVTILILIIKCRQEIMILAFTRLHISLPCRKVIKNDDKLYDAFIAYSEADGDWVFQTLLPRLELMEENNGPGFKLCIHHRDFPVGGCIADNIVDKVKESHHTVLILSNNFLQSHWCKYEFKTALTQSLMEKKRHLIIIIKEELDKHLIDKDLNSCLKTFTYVKTDDRLFWDKIIFALSDHERVVEKQQVNEMVRNNLFYNNNEHHIQPNNDPMENRNNNRAINQNVQQDGIWII